MNCPNAEFALRSISTIRSSDPEYGEAAKLRDAIPQYIIEARSNALNTSRQQMQRNFQGQASDTFLCSTSRSKEPIVSFDNGTYWWTDDGRCAQRLQKERDEKGKLHSYWPTTVRVDTDMNSFWLPDDEQTVELP